MSILLFSVISSVQANKKLRLQNRRYEVLSTISNEYLYEYKAKTDHLILSEKCRQLFENEQIFNEASRELKDFLSSHNVDDSNETIRLPLSNKETGVFKVINLRINDDSGRVDSVIGKLTDISEEAAEKEKLIAKSQLDGLTGLYNAATTKELITEKIKNKGSRMDAFVLIDGDDFKDINDTHGHLVGDQALKQIARSIKQTFRKTDIIGRIGGDEFCLYLQDFPSIDYVKDKCQQLNSLLQRSTEGEPISVSVGLTLVQENDEYDDVFKRADDALYEAKQKGKAQVVVSSLV
jgi:diguanylate cyclase (GGDEF)-like protein